MAGRWNPAQHPRDGNGRFRPKFSQSVRLSTSSISYNVGYRVPIVPGRANLYVGALARVENANGNQYLKNFTDKAINSVAKRFGDAGGRSNLAQVLKGNEIKVKKVSVQGPKRIIQPPTFRVSSTPATRTAGQVRNAPRVRNVRQPRIPRVSGVSGAVRTQAAVAKPKALPRGATAGRRARRRRTRGSRAARS